MRGCLIVSLKQVHAACMNKEEMLRATEEEYSKAEPDWWLCNDDSNTSCEPLWNSKHLIPVVRLHPMHEDDNHRLCVECRGIFEDPEMYWPFMDRDEIVPYNGWVDFVVQEVRMQQQQQMWWLCAKLLERKKEHCL